MGEQTFDAFDWWLDSAALLVPVIAMSVTFMFVPLVTRLVSLWVAVRVVVRVQIRVRVLVLDEILLHCWVALWWVVPVLLALWVKHNLVSGSLFDPNAEHLVVNIIDSIHQVFKLMSDFKVALQGKQRITTCLVLWSNSSTLYYHTSTY